MLKRSSALEVWYDRKTCAGEPVDHRIGEEIQSAGLILFLVSADFLSSPYCYDIEMKRGMERHKNGEARVIPVILRPCDWHSAPFGGLLAVPSDGKPVTSWANRDEAFFDIAKMIKGALLSVSRSHLVA